jgi:hypothetical protein
MVVEGKETASLRHVISEQGKVPVVVRDIIRGEEGSQFVNEVLAGRFDSVQVVNRR